MWTPLALKEAWGLERVISLAYPGVSLDDLAVQDLRAVFVSQNLVHEWLGVVAIRAPVLAGIFILNSRENANDGFILELFESFNELLRVLECLDFWHITL